MEEVVNLLKSILGVSLVFLATIFTCLLITIDILRDISRIGVAEDKKETSAYTIRCIGRKPTDCKLEWFVIGKEYLVKKGQVLDEQKWSWTVFKYDKTMLEAGGYLFFKVTKSE